jgi:predicted O-linked N-acetylglucosamine transferase (SPINDLY family)
VPPSPARRNGYVTFGSFNNFRKVNAGVVKTWARIMGELPDSRLVIVLRGGESNSHVHAMFEGHGVGRDRVRLVPRQAPVDYFRLQGEVDIGLDPFPYNGGITSLDGLWMGAPYVTLAGDRAVARAGLVDPHELGSAGPDHDERRRIRRRRSAACK